MDSIYRVILKKSWQITKKYKWLWFLGLFTALLGNGGEINTLVQSNKLANAPEFLARWQAIITNFDLSLVTEIFMERLSISPMLTTFTLAFYLVFFLLLIWIITVSQGGLIHAVGHINENKAVDFKKSLSVGQDKFWSILGLNVITRFIMYFVLIVLSLPFAILYLVNSSPAALVLLTMLAFIILVPIGIVISFILKYALAYVVLKKQKSFPAFILAWRLFIQNWLISIEMAILLFLINLGVGLTLVIFMILISLPFIGLIILIYLVQGIFLINTVIALLILIVTIPLLFVGAGLATFQFGSWTILFQKLQKGKLHPKLIRVLANKNTTSKK